MKVTISYGPANKAVRDYPPGTTVGTIINDRGLKSFLGYGDNVQALISQRHVSLDHALGSDAEITLETIANRKAADIHVTISYGPANRVEKDMPEGTTVGQVRRDRNILLALGVGSNVKALVDGQEQGDASPLQDGDEVVLETVANTKAGA